MERFAEAIVAGGVALVAGLWVLEFQPGGSAGWYGGAAVALAGASAIAAGIRMEIDV